MASTIPLCDRGGRHEQLGEEFGWVNVVGSRRWGMGHLCRVDGAHSLRVAEFPTTCLCLTQRRRRVLFGPRAYPPAADAIERIYAFSESGRGPPGDASFAALIEPTGRSLPTRCARRLW